MSLASSLLASFAGKDSTNFRRARARAPRISLGFYTLVLLAKASPLPFIATRRLAEGEPVNQRCTFHGRIKVCNNADSSYSNVPREHTVNSRTSRVLFPKLFRVQSVWRIQFYHFSGIFPEKEVFSNIGSDESCKYSEE